MGFVVAAALLLLLSLTPVRLTVLGRIGPGHRWQVHITLLGRALPVSDSEKLRQRRARSTPPSSGPKRTAGAVLRTFRASVHARGFLARHIHLITFDVQGRIALSDAAASCLLCGGLNSLLALFPAAWRGQVRLRVLPDFSEGQTYFQYRGIVAFRLGMIIAGALMLAAAHLRAQRSTHSVKEAAPWTIRSAN